jgi:16S rRNA (cytosine1402-N4)-methyltransferase
MVSEVLDALRPGPGDAALDLTVGTGGHSLRLARAVGPEGLLVGIDADPRALETARRRLSEHAPCPFRLFHAPFSRVRQVAEEADLQGFDLALADLGVGTHQLDDPGRGFSFDSTARLDMRYDTTGGPSAYEVVNQTAESELADIFYEYGEERYSRQIAARICRRRPVETPAELADLVKSVVARRTPRGRTWRIHPATRVMMALRIYVNRELEELEKLLEALPEVVAPGGRMAFITYHSLEARRVKRAWRRQQKQGLLETASPAVVMPTEQEVEQNPRVRSAQLRAAQMRGDGA